MFQVAKITIFLDSLQLVEGNMEGISSIDALFEPSNKKTLFKSIDKSSFCLLKNKFKYNSAYYLDTTLRRTHDQF